MADNDEGLKRLGSGRWQTRDERFTIEPESGTWAVVDAEQTDELGLPLVRGPFKSLTAAKEAIASARETAAPSSTLASKAPSHKSEARHPTTSTKPKAKAKPAPKEPEAPPEPRWVRDLEPAERRRAARLIERLTETGAKDPESVVRRDLVGEVPAIAAYAIERSIQALGDDASPADVVDALIDGRDADLGVRWRLVDDDGRPIPLDTKALRRSAGGGP